MGRAKASYDCLTPWVLAAPAAAPPDPEADMDATQAKQLTDIHAWMTAMKAASYPGIDGRPTVPAPEMIRDLHAFMSHEGRAQTLAIAALTLAEENDNDPDVIAEALVAAMPADIAGRVVDALAARIGKAGAA